MTAERCSVPRCRGGADLIYLGRFVCDFHGKAILAEDEQVEAKALAEIGLQRIEGEVVDAQA